MGWAGVPFTRRGCERAGGILISFPQVDQTDFHPAVIGTSR
jgi:hypothetical protein